MYAIFFVKGEHKSVKLWFEHVNGMSACQLAAHKVLQGKGLQGMKSYMQRQPAPQSNHSRDTQLSSSSPAEVSHIIRETVIVF